MKERLPKTAKVEMLCRLMKDLVDQDCDYAHREGDKYLITMIKHLAPNSYMIEKFLEDYGKICKWYE